LPDERGLTLPREELPLHDELPRELPPLEL
jgi:hypothetical protein